MISTSHRTLVVCAALVWYIGGIVLLIKGSSLLLEAVSLKPDMHWTWAAPIFAVLFGGIRARFLFSNSCRKNLARIAALDQPKIWQFFSPVFFILLSLMIVGGAALSIIAHGNYPFLLGMAALDLTVAVALLGSSYVFWRQK